MAAFCGKKEHGKNPWLLPQLYLPTEKHFYPTAFLREGRFFRMKHKPEDLP